jgi:hypothetical protein
MRSHVARVALGPALSDLVRRERALQCEALTHGAVGSH